MKIKKTTNKPEIGPCPQPDLSFINEAVDKKRRLIEIWSNRQEVFLPESIETFEQFMNWIESHTNPNSYLKVMRNHNTVHSFKLSDENDNPERGEFIRFITEYSDRPIESGIHLRYLLKHTREGRWSGLKFYILERE